MLFLYCFYHRIVHFFISKGVMLNHITQDRKEYEYSKDEEHGYVAKGNGRCYVVILLLWKCENRFTRILNSSSKDHALSVNLVKKH